jgi:hypothetical protein
MRGSDQQQSEMFSYVIVNSQEVASSNLAGQTIFPFSDQQVTHTAPRGRALEVGV